MTEMISIDIRCLAGSFGVSVDAVRRPITKMDMYA